MFDIQQIPWLAELYTHFVVFRDSPLGQMTQAVGAGVAAVAATAGVVYKTGALLADRRNARLLAEAAGVRSFTREDFRRARKYYVEPDCSNIDPANEADLRQAVSVRQPVFAALENELSPASGHRHILVLADSGMGKTTLLLNIFARRVGRSADQLVAVVPLNRPNALEQIRGLNRARDTILLLDALDEDVQAIGDYSRRLNELMQAASDFRKVVVTCRTQFFESDGNIPEQTGISRVAPRGAGERGIYFFRKLYLMPFSKGQTYRYIRKRIPAWQFGTRRRAWDCIAHLHDLPLRPMLLTEVPALARSRERVSEIYDLYRFVVDLWFERESRWISSQLLARVSALLAVDLLVGRGRRGSESMEPAELDQLLTRHGIDVDPSERWALTTRSLLNRDSAGRIKFAHRSIMEFFFVYAFVSGDRRALAMEWNDQVIEFFLSWARTTEADAAFLHRVRDEDFASTNLCPIRPARPGVVSQIGGPEFSQVSDYFSRVPLKQRMSPALEEVLARKQTLLMNHRGRRVARIHKVYDFARGVSVVIPTDFDNAGEAQLARAWEMSALREMSRDALPHVRCLGAVLRCIDLAIGLPYAFVRNRLYWLGDGKSTLRYAFRVESVAVESKPADPPEGSIIGSINFVGTRGVSRIDILSVHPERQFCIPLRVSFERADQRFREEYGTLAWADDYAAGLLEQGPGAGRFEFVAAPASRS